MIQNRVKTKVKNGEVALGIFHCLKEPAITEMLGLAGFDFVIIDMEHSATDLADMESLSRAAQAAGLTPFVRVPSNDSATLFRVVESSNRSAVTDGWKVGRLEDFCNRI